MKLYRRSIVFLLIYVSAFTNPLNLFAEEDKSKVGMCLVNGYGNSGMFAVFSGVLGSLDCFEHEHFAGLKIDIRQGDYLDPELGPNWWEYFFEPINLGDENAPHYDCTVADHLVFADWGFQMSRHRAGELIQKYILVKPHIQKKVDHLVHDYFDDYFVIGVHHRGTDKGIETPIVSYEKTVATINSVISELSETQKDHLRIFVSTDDANFVTHMLNLYPNFVVCNDHVRSEDSQPIHYGNDNKFQSMYQKGEEALIDCLLLSRCSYLIRPMSSLSIMADRFNRDLPTYVLWGDS